MILGLPPQKKFLVYFWRRIHDFLFFTLQYGITIGSAWWHAGE